MRKKDPIPNCDVCGKAGNPSWDKGTCHYCGKMLCRQCTGTLSIPRKCCGREAL